MKKYIVIQQLLTHVEQNGSQINNYWDMLVRVVRAKNKESAIGKFVINTREVAAKEKMEIICYEVDEITKID